MLILVTGKTSSGKTTLLKFLDYPNTVYLDDVVKEQFYQFNHPVYNIIKKRYGKKYVSNFGVKIKQFGRFLFENPKEFKNINEILAPFVKEYLSILKEQKEIYIVEMAVYINEEQKYKKFFDKVVLVKKNTRNLDNKFSFLKNDKKVNPIGNNEIKYDYLFANDNIEETLFKFKKLINGIMKR